MNREEKKLALNYILGNLSEEEGKKFEEDLASNDSLKNEFIKWKELTDFIEFYYKNKAIKKQLNTINIDELEEIQITNSDDNEEAMKVRSINWIQYVIMAVIALIISFIVYSLMGVKEEPLESNKEISNPPLVEVSADSMMVDNKIQSDVEISDIEITGIAINRTGFYAIPYSATEVKGVFGSNGSMTNNLPLNVVWDDQELGFAIATFADENLERLASLPYRFSKAESFLGEELFIIHSTKNGVNINKAIVIEDAADRNRMVAHLSFPVEMFGAILLDSKGLIAGLCEGEIKDGKVSVVKSKALYKMVGEMNLDKGVTYISMPSQNYLSNKSNAQRIGALNGFMAWFNAKPSN